MTDEFELYKKTIARIYRSDGAIVGSGFLVLNRHVLTCAHVVADALGIAHTAQDCPEDLVELDFPLLAWERTQKVQAKVVYWKPMSPEGMWVGGDDIAALKLEENLVEDILPIGLVMGKYAWSAFKVLGFPSGYDVGVWTKGDLRDFVGNGQVQMIVLEQSDYYVEGGFSGAPVWVDTLNGVAGIMVAAEPAESEKRKQVKAGFMIPVEVLRECWCDLEPCIKPRILETNIPIVQPLVTEPSSNQKIAEILCLLDYKQQEQEFRSAIEECKEGAFLVQTGEERIQRWLVRRLAKCVPDFKQAYKLSIRIRSHPMRNNFDAFWQEFKQDLGENLNREMVIQGLAEFCKTKSVIIVIYGISCLDAEKVGKFYAFWSDLVEKVSSIPRSFRSRLVLILAEKNSATLSNKLLPFSFVQPISINEINETQSSLKLTPLQKILKKDVENWLAQEDVYSKLNQTDDYVQSIVENDIPGWEEKPLEILDEICYTVFQIENGITAIEPYWKLAG
ncbi:ribosomal protein S6 [Rivularia sp. PCC 7116]|uniref:trypsin-like peptidase domain-containing protein n=1 Tax=Rivularia sp. PCC 7116 TaxID=373994 RepID=UPI00029EE078|nr:trypsin-like peptidase domain-containing protein [Rivularia sp. PCC 7116]AFY52644.1 ribosomal protein S6 [Rivularia sp. PCC 7116]